MPDKRVHRGPHPEDGRLFAEAMLARLHAAGDDLCWLLTRGYAPDSSLKLVGDRYELLKRQRVAVGRCVCSDDERRSRQARMARPEDMAGRALWLDGYNVLTTVEAALAGGVILAARDGAMRDMAGMHGTYRKVAETRPAIERIGRVVERLAAGEVVWYLDRPVSNSGRLRAILLETAAEAGWPWHVELVADPDPLLARSRAVVATADSAILDACGRWLNLARIVVETEVADPWVIQI